MGFTVTKGFLKGGFQNAPRTLRRVGSMQHCVSSLPCSSETLLS